MLLGTSYSPFTRIYMMDIFEEDWQIGRITFGKEILKKVKSEKFCSSGCNLYFKTLYKLTWASGFTNIFQKQTKSHTKYNFSKYTSILNNKSVMLKYNSKVIHSNMKCKNIFITNFCICKFNFINSYKYTSMIFQ